MVICPRQEIFALAGHECGYGDETLSPVNEHVLRTKDGRRENCNVSDRSIVEW